MMKNFWKKTPIWIKAIIIGVILLFPIVLVYQIILQLNLEVGQQFPWAALLVLVLFWWYWRITARSKKLHQLSIQEEATILFKRPKHMHPLRVVLIVLMLVILTASAMLIGWSFLSDLTDQIDYTTFIATAPIQTAIPLLLATAIGAGIIEEIVFRGYMQKMTELKYGVVFSFVFTAILFTVLHFLPLEMVVPYMAVSVVYSYVTYKSGSIIPAIFGHIMFDFIAFMAVYFDSKIISMAYVQGALYQHIAIAIGSILILIWLCHEKTKRI